MKIIRPLHGPTVIRTLGILAALGLVAAGAVVGLGAFPISARFGHLPGVSWVLHTTYNQAVTLKAHEEPPELTDAMAALGAKHFDGACRMCHSAPGYGQTATIGAMVPEPPHITEAVEGWEPKHLHFILYEGVKMSGMPHWPAPRPEEVWSTVAFLTRVEGMDRATYDALVARPDTEGGFAYCASCHGTDGVSGNPHIPRLDIQSEEYLSTALLAYREGMRASGIMEQAATSVTEADLTDYAARFADAPAGPASAQPSPLAEDGRALAQSGGPNVPACTSCHGPWPEPLDDGFPSLSGQYEPYLVTQLQLWRDGARGGGDTAELMHHAAQRLTDDDIAALAAYYAALPPARLNDAADPG